MKKNKIAIMTTNYLPNVGGLVSYATGLSSSCYREAEFTIFCTNGGDSRLKRSEQIENVMVKRVNIIFFRFLIFSPLVLFFSAIFQIIKNKKSLQGKELIIIRHFYYAAAMSFFPNLNKKSIFIAPLVATKLFDINHKNTKGILRGVYNLFVRKFIGIIEKCAFNNANKVAVLSSSKKDEINDLFVIKYLHVIYPGFNTHRFNTEIVGDSLHSELDFFCKAARQQDKKIIITVCRLVEEKNITKLIEALSLSNKYALLVVGDGPLLGSLSKQANKHEILSFFSGFVQDVEIYYKQSDLFVLPSTYEGFGHVYLEALACGCPIVGLRSSPPTIITATEEIIEEGVNGKIANDNTAIEFSRTIEETLALNLCRESISNHTYKRFSWTRHLRSLLDVVQNDI